MQFPTLHSSPSYAVSHVMQFPTLHSFPCYAVPHVMQFPTLRSFPRYAVPHLTQFPMLRSSPRYAVSHVTQFPTLCSSPLYAVSHVTRPSPLRSARGGRAVELHAFRAPVTDGARAVTPFSSDLFVPSVAVRQPAKTPLGLMFMVPYILVIYMFD
jgi:hypothetical protein